MFEIQVSQQLQKTANIGSTIQINIFMVHISQLKRKKQYSMSVNGLIQFNRYGFLYQYALNKILNAHTFLNIMNCKYYLFLCIKLQNVECKQLQIKIYYLYNHHNHIITKLQPFGFFFQFQEYIWSQKINLIKFNKNLSCLYKLLI